jgi:hypothetical protein
LIGSNGTEVTWDAGGSIDCFEGTFGDVFRLDPSISKWSGFVLDDWRDIFGGGGTEDEWLLGGSKRNGNWRTMKMNKDL